jgi:membrane fusion protein (multidrug efflux system)
MPLAWPLCAARRSSWPASARSRAPACAAAERLATIVPAGRTRAVAEFACAAGGRIAPGQRAVLRMEGFPWTRFGTLAATVERVASEPVHGRLRVELQLADVAGTHIPATHGLPGSAEVAVERVSPADLLLRAAGRLLTPDSPASPAAATVAAR